MNEVTDKKILSKKYYTLEEVISYLTINHNIIITVDDLIQNIVNKELTASIHLNIIKNKVNQVNHNYIADECNNYKISFKECLSFDAYHINDNELENKLEIDYDDFFNIDISQDKINILYKHLPQCFRLTSQEPEYSDLFILLSTINIKYIFPSQIRILHSSLVDFLSLKGIIETTATQDKEISGKSETSYLNIIQALKDELLAAGKFKNQSELITFLADKYQGYTGLTESNLRDKFAKANQIK